MFFVEFAVDDARDGRTWESVGEPFETPRATSRAVRDVLHGNADEVRVERRPRGGDDGVE